MSEVTLKMLREHFGDRFRVAEPLHRHTSFRIGGPADLWAEANSCEEVQLLRRFAKEDGIPIWVLGGGTNVLVSDRGVRGLVLHMGRGLSASEWKGREVRAGAAMTFKRLVNEAIGRSLSGLEFGEGIPGSVGGGLLMNAGAFGGEISEVVSAVEGVDVAGEIRELKRSKLKFSYRHFSMEKGFIVSHVRFSLKPDEAELIKARRENVKRKRTKCQPLGYPNAGSVFRNPPGEFAGRLIESVGLKGHRVGAAMLSDRHANFIVNLGGATASDVKSLMRTASERVQVETGVLLQPEIKLVGEW